MSDKYNDFNDDFFAKFDEIAEKNEESSSGISTYSAEAGDEDFFYGGGRDYRGESTKIKPSRAERAASAAEKDGKPDYRAKRHAKYEKKKAKEAARKAKADVRVAQRKAMEKAKSSTARAVAAASKFGGSASGATNYKPLKPETKVQAILKTLVTICLICVFAVGIYVGLIFLKAPIINTDDIYSQINQRSVMYDCNGKEIENLFFSDGNRTVVEYKDMPQNMVNAVVAIEDQKFWTHNGFNFIRMVGAIKDSVFGGGEISGTSTVTQQLARNVYLSEIKSQRSLSRKITEMYCTIVLEKNLSKEQIMEAYLNTIYLGFNSYGIEAAAEGYFDTRADKLNLEQCAALAALPQSPDTYALVYSDYYNTNTSLPKIKKTESVTYLYNGDMTKDRRDFILNTMASKGSITQAECDKAKAANLKDEIKIGTASDADKTSYFTDYALKQLIEDMTEEYKISESDAENMIYTKGLKIYTTMDKKYQTIMEEEFNDDSNFTSIAYTRTNADGDITSDQGVILAYHYGYYFNENGNFVLKKGDYTRNSDGSMTIKKGKRLNLYHTESESGTDISIEFKGMYKKADDGKFYFIESGALSIPAEYKSLDDNGNCVISAQFFSDYPNFFKKSDEGKYIVNSDNFSLKQKVRQPQAAAVLMENKTGEIKAMMGGRGATGKQLYNRAINPRQPGSSIKPLATYGPALQMSYEYNEAGKKLALDNSEGSDWGKFVTAGSVIEDGKTVDGNGKTWPVNDDHRYHGSQTFREALQQSLNVVSYKIYQQIDRNVGAQYSLDMLEKCGVTTLADGDCNPAAISLGGLTRGLTPLEETAAYAVFPNGGVYKTPIFYTKVLDTKDDVLFEKKTEETQVYDPGVAWIMTDVLRSVVTNGIGRSASISSQPAAGKTGTTSNMYDIWFSGFTPQFSMALWMGNDINMSVSNYSYKAAGFWASIMQRVCEDLPRGSYREMPSNVERVAGEYYIKGTYYPVHKKKTKESKTKTETETETETTTTTTEAPTEPPTVTDSTEPTVTDSSTN
ncbi:MAG: penicillin-binding protein [Clostridia bacterium]|nr:penicillin-binding protein [Clostridia bacterium]